MILIYVILCIEVECIIFFLYYVFIYLFEKKFVYLLKIFVNEKYIRIFCVYFELIILMYILVRNFLNLYCIVCCDIWLYLFIFYWFYEFLIIINFMYDFFVGIFII